MVLEILNYGESGLNPFLKLLVPLLLVVGCYYLYLSYTKYGGGMKQIAYFLLIMGIVGVVSSGFRFIGGLDPKVWKWGESVLMLAFAAISILVAYRLRDLFQALAVPD